ncbi:MAG: methylated-DNA--[protein]-cysteine S-methyltransferase [Candidatus Thiodiazotropha sp. (ex Dulcina madagascariensis)]|nr:methylated-DNA--[protein]-cysteine S-methyltransferase [Candidatus Thiodiazotropha sp. (ex Epidulcina cf. delphinae)]MCU7922678.1 methylated-DNA--[protein]-cysteine S-methyltransferase [Candidatus Thiodiazotropha sp. (ex Dulcina madagascariensis)]MCU7928116.1 methylated-DNA--[protein]-cysteine S-methyltransferase [Candidatus Thiodiazotropha sp. (ex Dulcina madagascariensis)]MCU7936802.1 methylated-DNA--[protein]-cysteine S-methyltransferase [Candidatus Thiodiazotropha sp. (ex Dulcina madagasc
MTTYYHYHATPIGKLLLAGNEEHLKLLGFPNGSRARRHEPRWQKSLAPFRAAIQQLDEYFAGDREQFDLSLAPQGTDFQRQVWQALCDIPYGETWSYGQLAKYIGRPKASRAVGAANGLNPIPVIIPCHRVVGCNGKLTGFGGGIETKAFLLNLEAEGRTPGLNFAF